MGPLEILDSHVHFSAVGRVAEFLRYLTAIGAERAGIVSLPDRRFVNFNPEAFAAKLGARERLFVFGGFDYTAWFFPERKNGTPPLEAQVERLARLGADGIKMWAGKPPFQRELGFGLDDEVYSAAYEAAAALSLPIVLHVADPPEFWRTDRSRFGWSLGGASRSSASMPTYESLQRQAETILERHRKTLFIFPHLLFRAGDLESLSRFMGAHRNAYLDLSPGLYFYAELHRQHVRAVEFFGEFRERIIFGTDAMWFDRGHPYLPYLTVDENVAAARRLVDFLTSAKPLENPFAFSQEELPTLRGLALPDGVLRPIFSENFHRIVGTHPRKADEDAIAAYGEEIASLRRSIAEAESAQ